MSTPRGSIFRDGVQVSRERIASLSDDDLSLLMEELLKAHAYRCGSPVSEIRVNTEGRAGDAGCDGWSAAPEARDEWFGSTDTCWQFKAGTAGGPARLAGEVTKHIPRETLLGGARFVVVASGSKSGASGERSRRKRLTDEAREAGIPTSLIDVIGSERLAIWCNQHPAVAARWAGHPNGLWTLDQWIRSDEHQVSWQAEDSVQSNIETLRDQLDFSGGDVVHLHIQGPPGVGKTRFALELCRGAPWHSSVIYVRQASDVRLNELIDGAVADQGVRLLVVADEVQFEDLRSLRDSITRSDGRVRLITIGHCRTPEPARIPSHCVVPLRREAMEHVVRGWSPMLPAEHVDFVVHFADGYVRLAKLATEAVARNPQMDTRGLLGHDEISGFLDRMLGIRDSSERMSLYVVAALANVGWKEDKQDEGEAIARHFDLEWNHVRVTVESLNDRCHVVPRSGRYRYISPTSLGNYLAVQAWMALPDRLRTLPEVLPSEAAREAYYERLKGIASSPYVRDVSREQLTNFFSLNEFMDARAVRRWAALSSADPYTAARGIATALSQSDVEARHAVTGPARRVVVHTLVRLAWGSISFHEAVKALALLAEAENETWANNATGEFVGRFQITLGGTAVPFLDRLPVLDELRRRSQSLDALIIRALAQVGDMHEVRTVHPADSDRLPEMEWRPKDHDEHIECIRQAVDRLRDFSLSDAPWLRDQLVEAAQTLSNMLIFDEIRGAVARFFQGVLVAYPETRETLRQTIKRVIDKNDKYWHKLSPDARQCLERLHQDFRDTSLAGQLKEEVGQASWDSDEQVDLAPLAARLMDATDVLEANWTWLTSGRAAEAWRLGRALGQVDSNDDSADRWLCFDGCGPDQRLVCGYVAEKRRQHGDAWYNAWVLRQIEREPTPVALMFEMAHRCGITRSVIDVLIQMLHEEDPSAQTVGQLSYGGWWRDVAFDDLRKLLEVMAGTGNEATVAAILSNRMKEKRDEFHGWKPLALRLVTTASLIRSGLMESYHWKEIALLLVPVYTPELVAAIFREQADRNSGNWFIEHSQAKEVVIECVKHNPHAVWTIMRRHLSTPRASMSFGIGFPSEVLGYVPADEVLAWVRLAPDEHGAVLARLCGTDLSSDATLMSRTLGEFADNDAVSNAFVSNYLSGSWWGPSSVHWAELARKLETVAQRTAFAKLRIWAHGTAHKLRDMARRDREREEEEDVRRP